MPGRPRALSAAATVAPSIHGAPYSIEPTPGYSVAWVRFRMFGDGFTHDRPVSSNQWSRRQLAIGTTARSTPIFFSSLNSFASSPIVKPCRTGIEDR
jgi:hypothetical protein